MIKEIEQLLFSKWETSDNFDLFVKDGVFDEDEWCKQPVKILFVLKEANFKTDKTEKCAVDKELSINNFGNDLCKYLLSQKSPTYWKTWNNVVRWTQAIRDGGEYQRYVSKEDKSKCLKTIAALNIKKEAGGATANAEEITAFGKKHACYIRKQINLYQPDIIVCCGYGNANTADIICNNVLNNKSDKQKTTNGYNYYLCNLCSGKQVPVLSFQHPQMRGGHAAFEKSYNDMLEIASEFKKLNII